MRHKDKIFQLKTQAIINNLLNSHFKLYIKKL